MNNIDIQNSGNHRWTEKTSGSKHFQFRRSIIFLLALIITRSGPYGMLNDRNPEMEQ
jgi:hypothetical protein